MRKAHTLKTKKPIVFYLTGPIEFLDDPDRGWREEFAQLFRNRFPDIEAEFINPVKVSYLVGKSILDNVRHAKELKASRDWTGLKGFMDKIWGQDAVSVDRSDMIVMWARTASELKESSSSIGSVREALRLIGRGGYSCLICDPGIDLTVSNTHFLHIFLSSGGIFSSPGEFFDHLEQENSNRS